ncbi:MAG: F0F1 ATP synthase subunit B [Defluviitaleaceae bacterium]|nr:F0F1 ATP synthase subunit B [Defluviitaleaceae bacterium]
MLDVMLNNVVVLNAGAIDSHPRFIAFDWVTITEMLFLWFNAGVLIFILSWLLYKPVKEFLHNRRDRISSELKKAADDMEKAASDRKLYEDKLVAINSERDDILAGARKLAQDKEAEIIQNAKNEARLEMERAKVDIEREKEKARDEMRTQIISVGALMAEKLLGQGMDDDAKDRILSEAITELGDAVWTE